MARQDEEPEPQLKYELLGGDVQSIVRKEKITCMTVSEKILAIGTDQGKVHVLDYSGNQVRLLNLHKARVNDLSFDKEAEHIASASNDSSVVVTNLYTDQITRHEFRSPIKAVAIDPRPPASVRKTWRDLVTGTAAGEVTLSTQGWLARADQPMAAASSRDAAAGGVLAIKWSGTLVAWAYDSVVTVYDTVAQQPIRTLRRHDARAAAPAMSRAAPQPVMQPAAAAAAASASPIRSPALATTGGAGTAQGAAAPTGEAAAQPSGGGSSALRRCSLLFAPDSHLYVAWSDTILVARIWSYENNMGSLSPQVELVARMKLGEAVLGVSPYGDSDLAVLVYPSGVAQPAVDCQQTPAPQQQTAVQHQQAQKPGESQPQRDQLPRQPPQQQQHQQHQQQQQQRQGAPQPADAACEASGTAEEGPEDVQEATVGSHATATEARTAKAAPPAVASADASSVSSEALPLTGPPPDPLAPGRTPQLVILGRSDHREWARDSVPLPGADGYGPAEYLGLMPSLPHHLHLPATAAAAAAAAAVAAAPSAAALLSTAWINPASALGNVFSSGSRVQPHATAAAASPRPSMSRESGGGSSYVPETTGSEGGAASASPAPSAGGTAAAEAAPSAAAMSAAGRVAAPAAPRRLVPVWVDGQELIFFIAAPMAIASARSRDSDDRVGWLLARQRWDEALSVVEEAPQGLAPGTYDRVIDGYIMELLKTQSYDRAVQLSERLLKTDAKRWEQLVYLFAQARQLPKLVGRLPTHNPRLRSQVYEMALQSLLPNPADHHTLMSLARAWPAGCYSLAALADAVAARLRRLQHQPQHPSQPATAAPSPSAASSLAVAGAAAGGGGGSALEQGTPTATGEPLWQLLAWLYEQQGRPDLALSIHLRLKSPTVFSFVTHHGLQSHLLGRAPDLFEVDPRAALGLLTAHVDALPPANVVPSLQEAIRSAPSPAAEEVWRRRLYGYLKDIFAADSSVGADYHDLQVSLTAEYEPSKLMDLLVSSQYYSLEAALAICEARGLVSEQVFVLGRMGNADQALRLIIDRLGDIPRAIDFVVGQRDHELWGQLIAWALRSPETTGALLDCIGGYVDPLVLVRRIPRGMRVERLRDRLRAIIADYRTQTSLREGCNAILRSDCRHLLAKLYDGTRRALPYLYVVRPGGGGGGGGGSGGEGGQWYRCDVVHGGKLHSVSAAEVPKEVLQASGGLRPVVQSSPAKAPAVPAAGGGRGKSAGAVASAVAEGLPWWAQSGGSDDSSGGGGPEATRGSPVTKLWVGFTKASGPLGSPEDGLTSASAAAGGSRRPGPFPRPGTALPSVAAAGGLLSAGGLGRTPPGGPARS